MNAELTIRIAGEDGYEENWQVSVNEAVVVLTDLDADRQTCHRTIAEALAELGGSVEKDLEALAEMNAEVDADLASHELRPQPTHCAKCGELLGDEDLAEVSPHGVVHAGCFDSSTMELA